MTTSLKILLLEDSPEDVVLIRRELSKAGLVFTSEVVNTREEFTSALADFRPDVILSDHSLPEFNSVEALKIYKQARRHYGLIAPFILITGSVSEEFAVQCIKDGAADYILKDRLARLPSAVTGALEQQRAKEEKRKVVEEQKRLLQVLQKSVNEIYIFNPDTLLFEYFNDSALHKLGYTSEELRRLTPLHLMPSFTRPLFESILEGVQASEAPKTMFESVYVRKNGTRYPVEVHLQLIDQEARRSFLLVVIDITVRKEAEREKELAQHLSRIFSDDNSLEDNLRQALEEICRQYNLFVAEAWVTSIDGMYMQLAATYGLREALPHAGEKSFFIRGEGIVGTAWRQKSAVFVPDILKDGIYQRKEFARANGFASVLAVPVTFRGEVIAVFTFYSKKRKASANDLVGLGPSLLAQLASDIRRKKAEEELNGFFRLSPDIIGIVGTDGYIKKINPSICAILGYEAEELMGQPYLAYVHPDDHEKMLLELDRVRQSPDPLYFEIRLITRTGDTRWIAWTASPVVNASLVFAVGKDITQKKRAEEALLALNEELAAARLRQQQEITQAVLTAQESERQHIGRELHDNINQVLSSARLYMDMCTVEGDNAAFLQRATDIVNTAINEIRALSHTLIPPSLANTGFGQAARDLLEAVELSGNLAIIATIDLPAETGLSGQLKLTLYRIIQEALHNITKYAQASRVELELRQLPGSLFLKIADNGVGFDTTQKPGGVGLLNMRTRVSLFNGTLQLQSAPGQGCTLSISIPLQEAEGA